MKPRGNLTAYRIWAPDGVLWSEWAKPVLFAEIMPHIDNKGVPDSVRMMLGLIAPSPPPAPEPVGISDIHFAASTAVIVDLPGVNGVDTAMTLAQMGYRPVPLYNGVNSHKACMVDSSQFIADALISRASELAAIEIDDGAPPVFMLDSNRMTDGMRPLLSGMFDNRWRVFPQDMPSADFLKKQGIKTIIVRADGAMKDDLARILSRYQKQGIIIRSCDGKNPVKVIRLSESLFELKKAFYRYTAIAGLRPNDAGGFGGFYADSSSGGG